MRELRLLMADFNFLFVPAGARVHKVYQLTLRLRYYDLSSEQKIKEQLRIRDKVLELLFIPALIKGLPYNNVTILQPINNYCCIKELTV